MGKRRECVWPICTIGEIGAMSRSYTQAGGVRDERSNGRFDGDGSGASLVFECLAMDTHRSAKPRRSVIGAERGVQWPG
jgi:hypothetical protein